MKNPFIREILVSRTLLWFAYFLVFTTPIQIAFCLWTYSFLFSPEYSLMTFSTSDFLELTFLKPIKVWMYSWFWNNFLNFVWSLPASIMVTVKLIVNTWLGLWLLPIAKDLNDKKSYQKFLSETHHRQQAQKLQHEYFLQL